MNTIVLLTYTVAEFLSLYSAQLLLKPRRVVTNIVNVIEMIRTAKITTTPMAVIRAVKGNEPSPFSSTVELGGEVTTELGLGVGVDSMMSGLMIQPSSVMLKLSLLPN